MSLVGFINGLDLPDGDALLQYKLLAVHAEDPDVRQVLMSYGNKLLDTAGSVENARSILTAIASRCASLSKNTVRQDVWAVLVKAASQTSKLSQLSFALSDVRYEIQQEIMAVVGRQKTQ